jgi:hypothetical protein
MGQPELEYGILSAGPHVNCEREFACRSGARYLWALLCAHCQTPAVPMVHKMSVVIRGAVFSNSGLVPKIADVARDVFFRSVHPC